MNIAHHRTAIATIYYFERRHILCQALPEADRGATEEENIALLILGFGTLTQLLYIALIVAQNPLHIIGILHWRCRSNLVLLLAINIYHCTHLGATHLIGTLTLLIGTLALLIGTLALLAIATHKQSCHSHNR